MKEKIQDFIKSLGELMNMSLGKLYPGKYLHNSFIYCEGSQNLHPRFSMCFLAKLYITAGSIVIKLRAQNSSCRLVKWDKKWERS